MTTEKGTPPAGSTARHDAVGQYYRDTRWHYRGLWSGRRTFALHYGYWSPGVRSHADSLHELNSVMAQRVDIRPDEHVLDAGCGVGGSSIWLAENRGATAHGINIEPGQVYRAREIASTRGVADRATFSLGDLTDMEPVPDGSVDVVWGIESVCYAPDKADFCREAFRVLRPGGRLVVADFFRPGRDVTAAQEERTRDWFSQWVITDLDTLDEFSASAVAAGFGGVAADDVTDRVRPSARRLFAIGLMTSPIALVGRRSGLSSELQHANWLSTLRQYTTLRAGLWKYGIVSGRKQG